VCDPDFTILESNRAADIILGKGESLKHQKCFDALRRRNEKCLSCPLTTTLESGKILPYIYYDRTLNEYFEERLFPITDEENNLSHFVLTCRNISETRAIENQNSQMKKLSALGKISSGVAHDFNNILTVINGRISIMKKKSNDPDILKNLQILEKAASDGAEKIRGIQDFARHKNDEKKALINLKKLIMQTLEITEPKWRNEAIKSGILIEPILNLDKNIFIKGIESELRNGFANIIFNAIDAMPDGGLIKILSKTKHNFAVISFQDTGIGMTEEVQEKIFDPFYTTKGEKGTGMGMSEVYGIIKRHNGLIDIESIVGIGTKITFKLPLENLTSQKDSAQPYKNHSQISLLSVSTNEFYQNLIQKISSNFDIDLLLCNEYEQAEKKLYQQRPGILITNLAPPMMKGLKLAQAAKKIKRNTITVLLPEIMIPPEEMNIYSRSFDYVINPPQTMDKIKLHMTKIVNSLKEEQ
jgi:signal transduction histidine kinase